MSRPIGLIQKVSASRRSMEWLGEVGSRSGTSPARRRLRFREVRAGLLAFGRLWASQSAVRVCLNWKKLELEGTVSIVDAPATPNISDRSRVVCF